MVQVYYSDHHRNFGDALNPYLLERILNIPVRKSTFHDAQIVCVGSLLQKCTAPKYDLFKRISGCFNPELQVLSTGFIAPVPGGQVLCRKLAVKAIRGHESRRIVEKLSRTSCCCAVGDGGLLYPWLLDKMPEKKYALGIIPHYRDQQHPAVREIAALHPGAVVIDVLDEPLEVLKKIAACQCVLSSSLHGLIVSDAMGIPNRHVSFSGNVTGNEFKFRDYYSVFAPEYHLPVLEPVEVMQLSAEELFREYLPREDRVAELQKQLFEAMKF